MTYKVGDEVYNKFKGYRGFISKLYGETVSITLPDGFEVHVLRPRFERAWTIIPQDTPESYAIEEGKVDIPFVDKKGELLGKRLRNKFMSIISNFAIDGITYRYNPRTKSDVIKYNGYNVFECRYTKKKLHVMCHPSSLTPANKKRISKLYPKSTGWSLRAQVTFDEEGQGGLMRSIIADGLFYRREPKPSLQLQEHDE